MMVFSERPQPRHQPAHPTRAGSAGSAQPHCLPNACSPPLPRTGDAPRCPAWPSDRALIGWRASSYSFNPAALWPCGPAPPLPDFREWPRFPDQRSALAKALPMALPALEACGSASPRWPARALSAGTDSVGDVREARSHHAADSRKLLSCERYRACIHAVDALIAGREERSGNAPNCSRA